MKGLDEIASDNDNVVSLSSIWDRPFPNLRTREIVKHIVEGIVETNAQCKGTPAEQERFALGYIRGALTVTGQDADNATGFYLASLLATLNSGGLAAINRLVEVVTGAPLKATA